MHKDYKFKASLGYEESTGLDWATLLQTQQIKMNTINKQQQQQQQRSPGREIIFSQAY